MEASMFHSLARSSQAHFETKGTHSMTENYSVLSPEVRDIAAKAQTRLCGRYRALSRRGKKLTVAVTAIARELGGLSTAVPIRAYLARSA